MNTNTRTRRPQVLLALLALPVVALTGLAAAFWAELGSGAGAVTSGDTEPLMLNSGSPTAQLYPGGLADVVVSVTNPNDATVRVGMLVLETAEGTGGFTVDAGHAACGVSSLGFTAQTNGGAGWTVVGDQTDLVSLPDALSMNLAALDACQGAVFTVHLKVGA